MGTDGARTVVVNSVGREIRTLDEVDPIEGRRLKLTIDYDVQKAAEDGFKALRLLGRGRGHRPAQRRGAVAGEPAGLRPERVCDRDRSRDVAALNTDQLRPLQNRVIQGRYSPGSTFKIVVAVAALEEGVVTPDFKVVLLGRRRRSTAATSSAT